METLKVICCSFLVCIAAGLQSTAPAGPMMELNVNDRGRGYARHDEQAAVQGGLVILNPYRFVDWESWGRYKSNLHSHTRLHKLEADGSVVKYGAPGYEESEGVAYGSDGSHLPCEVIDKYREYGFDILAITDHDPFYGYGDLQESYPGRTTYPWTLWGRDPEELGMIAVEGQELTNPHGALGADYEHDVSLFNDLGGTDQHKTGYDREERIRKVADRMGLLMLAHPRGVVTASELAGQAAGYNAARLIEVFTRADSTDARKLWDEALGLTMPFLPIWGVSVDDMHVFRQLGTNYSIHLMPRFDTGAVRHSLERGEFYFTMDPLGNDSGRHDPVKAPVITAIKVSGTQIRISAENYDRIFWISAGGRIAEGETIDVSEVRADNYVRAELYGCSGAVTCTQPFGIINTGKRRPR